MSIAWVLIPSNSGLISSARSPQSRGPGRVLIPSNSGLISSEKRIQRRLDAIVLIPSNSGLISSAGFALSWVSDASLNPLEFGADQ